MTALEKIEQLGQLLDIAKENYNEYCINENGDVYKRDIEALEWAIGELT